MTDAMRWMPWLTSLRVWRRGLLVLMMALVLVQTLGALHRVAHAQHAHNLLVTPTTDDSTAGGSLPRLWGEHSNWVTCQVFDQAAPDFLYNTPVLMPLTSQPPLVGCVVLYERFASVARFFPTRGPPLALN